MGIHQYDQNYTFDPKLGKATVRNLDYFPRELFKIADQIKVLDMSTVTIGALPDDFGRFVNLQVAFFSHNPAFHKVPEVLAECHELKTIGMRDCNISVIPAGALPASLKALILTDNQLSELPASIGDCTKLQKLSVTGNQLTTLPKRLLDCQNLELIRLSVNKLNVEPDWLFALPKLAWYADSHNLYSSPMPILERTLADWSDVTLGPEIGRSANAVVHEGSYQSRAVAVKLYGYTLASDGLASDDIAMCLQVGGHSQIIGGIAALPPNADGSQGLIMPLVDPTYTSLGWPPSLVSVCRDTYGSATRFTMSYIKQAAIDIANALQYIHSRGVMHGDMYAHNILTNSAGKSYLGDFGAASHYDLASNTGKQRQRIDIRAFGILLQELLDRLRSDQPKERGYNQLRQIEAACLSIDPDKRPLFDNISEMLPKLYSV